MNFTGPKLNLQALTGVNLQIDPELTEFRNFLSGNVVTELSFTWNGAIRAKGSMTTPPAWHSCDKSRGYRYALLVFYGRYAVSY